MAEPKHVTLGLAMAFLTVGSLGFPAAPWISSTSSIAGFGADAAAIADAAGKGDLPGVVAGLARLGPARATEPLVRALGEEARLSGFVDRLGANSSLAAKFVDALDFTNFPFERVPTESPAATFAGAATALLESSGVPMGAAEREQLGALAASLPPPAQESMARLMTTLLDAVNHRHRAFAALDEGELEFMASTLTTLARTGTGPHQPPGLDDMDEIADALQDRRRAPDPWGPGGAWGSGDSGLDWVRFADVAKKVDRGLLATSAWLALRGVDEAMSDASHFASDGIQRPPLPAVPVSLEACPAGYDAPLGSPGPIQVGLAGPECFSSPAVLSIDLGGDDLYTSNAGGNMPFPLAVALDLGGNDDYHGAPGAQGTIHVETFTEGAGMMGVGILVDAQGDDDYNSNEVLDSAPGAGPSPPGSTASYRAAFVQGAGALGVGVLADLSGADLYNSFNVLHQRSSFPQATLDYDVEFAQGAGLGGVGLFLDGGTEDDAYNSFNVLVSDEQDLGGNFPAAAGFTLLGVSDAQGTGLSQGVGVHADAGGDDAYNSMNRLVATPNPNRVGAAGQSTSFLFASCVQGGVGPCAAAPGDPGLPGGTGVLVDVAGGSGGSLGDDDYNSRNSISGSPTGTRFSNGFAAFATQGAAYAAVGGVGLQFDGAGNDQYNSANVAKGEHGLVEALIGQGGASADGALAVQVDVQGDDALNSFNLEAGTSGSNFMVLEGLQGTVVDVPPLVELADLRVGLGAFAARADLAGADRYNSFNTQTTVSGTNALLVGFDQGVAAAFGLQSSLAAFVDTDVGLADFYNSRNQGSKVGVASGSASYFNLQGVSFRFGAAAMLDVGGANEYNANNLYHDGLLTEIEAVSRRLIDVGPARAPDGVALFADLGLSGPDLYNRGPWAGPIGGSPCQGAGAILIDALDGQDVAPFPNDLPGLLCLDL